MPYLNLDVDYFTNRKVVRLMGVLGAEHVAVPIRLWCYVAKHHPEKGELCGYSKEEIESAVGWNGEPHKMVDAMLKDGISLLEEIPNGYRVHDWEEHAGHLWALQKRAKAAAKERWRRIASSNAKDKITNAPNHLIPPNHPNQPSKPTKHVTKSARGTCLDALNALTLNEGLQSWAMDELGLRIPEDVLHEFKAYWQGKTTLRTDWESTFKNRVRQLVGLKILQPKPSSVWDTDDERRI